MYNSTKSSKTSFPDSFHQEFDSVITLLQNNFSTGSTDAFVVAYVKVEKQVRKIFTYLVYQMSSFTRKDTKDILGIIASKRYLYFSNFIQGFDNLYDKPFHVIVGQASCDKFLKNDFSRIKAYRNKILHGQPTGRGLSSKQLAQEVAVMSDWCFLVASNMQEEIGFDGFIRNSFRKSKPELGTHLVTQLNNTNELDTFIETHIK